MQSTDINKNQDLTFTVCIQAVPNKNSDGEYSVTDWRNGVKYYDDWYCFSGVLGSIDRVGEEVEIPENLKINVCVPLEGERTNKIRKHVFPLIEVSTWVKCKGNLRKINSESKKPEIVDIADVEQAYEIWVEDIVVIPVEDKVEYLAKTLKSHGIEVNIAHTREGVLIQAWNGGYEVIQPTLIRNLTMKETELHYFQDENFGENSGAEPYDPDASNEAV